jgi:hypothetical protein
MKQITNNIKLQKIKIVQKKYLEMDSIDHINQLKVTLPIYKKIHTSPKKSIPILWPENNPVHRRQKERKILYILIKIIEEIMR